MLAHRTRHDDFAPHPLQEASVQQEQSMAQRVVEYIDQNYSRPISLRHVADAFGYSSCHLTHTFSLSTGTPITAWIIKRRILAAQELLRKPNVNVAAACEAVGFNDLCYFTRQFVRHVGMTPGRFRSAMNGTARGATESAARAH